MNKDVIKPKTLSINYDVYALIKNKQTKLIAETGKYYQMVDITDLAIRAGIDEVGLDYFNKLSINPENPVIGMEHYECGCSCEILGDQTYGKWKLCQNHSEYHRENIKKIIQCWICQDGTPAMYIRDCEDHEEVLCKGCLKHELHLNENEEFNEEYLKKLNIRKITKEELDNGEIEWN